MKTWVCMEALSVTADSLGLDQTANLSSPSHYFSLVEGNYSNTKPPSKTDWVKPGGGVASAANDPRSEVVSVATA